MSEKKCAAKVEVWSRVCGFFRPVQQWNRGKKEEFKERKEFVVDNKLDSRGDAEGAEK